jgi:hypothetical protein
MEKTMKPWKQALQDGMLPGTLAGLSSLLAMAWRGRRETGSALAPLNAPSHWVWGDQALRKNNLSWRYTGLGLLIHQGSAMFWGVLYERFIASTRRTHPLAADLRDAVVATAAAATVDLVLTPKRFTPGFERRLSPQSLLVVYLGFAIGVAAGSRYLRRR